MKCYRCGKVLTRHTFCPYCGADVKTYSKVLKMSNTYYNMGLTKAENRDLQGAAIFLRQSVKLDKYNTNARNLLGLCYMEMGEVVQAMAEWLISQSLQPENNLANSYIKEISANQNRFDVIARSIHKFNVALKEAKEGNDDVALIQLKRVIQQNPNMIKAHQLLALLYMQSGQLAKARKVLKRSLTIDRCNTVTLKYMRSVEELMDLKRKEAGRRKKKEVEDRPYLSGDDVVIPYAYKEQKSGIFTVLNVLTGVLIGVLAFFFLVLPGKLQEQKTELSESLLAYDQTIVRLNATVTQYEQQIGSLQGELDGIKADTTEETIIANYKAVLEAYQEAVKEQPDMEYVKDCVSKINAEVTIEDEMYKEIVKVLKSMVTEYNNTKENESE